MSTTSHAAGIPRAPRRQDHIAAFLRTLVIGLISFLTLVDLFAAQAILPTLVEAYKVTPAEMGVAVNASTFGMAASGLIVALASQRINRRRGIWVSLALLSIPTALLAQAPDLATFTALRIAQGVFMSAAFTLTLAYLAEHCSAQDSASAFAAYITGNVASNLFGRILSAGVADHLGLEANFYVFALLNLSGAALVFFSLMHTAPLPAAGSAVRSALAVLRAHLGNGALRAGFAIGFIILFVFIGTFTYVNFVLTAEPIGLGPMELGLVYLVFLPSILTTPFAGRVALRLGARTTLWASLAVAGAALPLLLAQTLTPVLAGLTLMGVGTFFAQAAATGFVSRAATADRGSASGLYLASYYLGGLVGSAVLGLMFERFGWQGCVAGLGIALGLAALLTLRLHVRKAVPVGVAAGRPQATS